MPGPKGVLLILFFLLASSATGRAQRQVSEGAGGGVGVVVTGSLADLKRKRRVLVLVRRSNVVDSRGSGEAILEEVFREDAAARIYYPRIYNSIVRKLNKYMVKYQSITAARNTSEAEFIVFFNLLEYRRLLGRSYAYGELFVILNETDPGRRPRIIWKSPKSPVWVEDAIEDLIKNMIVVRGEE
jgi:hypothetical protein